MPGPGRPFVRGTSGNPRGRPKRGAAISDHLRHQLAQVSGEDGTSTVAAELARVLIQKGREGDVAALKLLLERLEGPPTLQHTGGGGTPIRFITIEETTYGDADVPADAAASDALDAGGGDITVPLPRWPAADMGPA